MVNTAPAEQIQRSEERNDREAFVWPVPLPDVPRTEAEKAVVKEEHAVAPAPQIEAPFDGEEYSKLLSQKGAKIETLEEAAKKIEGWLEDEAFMKFNARDQTPLKVFATGVVKASGAGILSGIGSALTSTSWCGASFAAVCIGAGVFAAVTLGYGLMKALSTGIGRIVSSRRKDASYYERQIMLRACSPDLDEATREELLKASLQSLRDGQQKLRQELEEFERGHAAEWQAWKDAQYDKVFSDIQKRVIS